MEAVLEMPMVAVEASVMDDVRDAVGNLNTKVAVLATQHGYLIEAINRVEMAVSTQSATSDEYRKTLMTEVMRTTDTVKAMEVEIEMVKGDIAKLTERTVGAWIRKNAALTVSIMVALSMFIATVRWFIIHYVK